MMIKLRHKCILFILVLNSFNNLSAELNSQFPGRNDLEISKVYQYLEEANNVAKSIKDIENRAVVTAFLKSYKEQFEADYLAKDYEALKTHISNLYENMDEILSDCNENEPRETIGYLLSKLINENLYFNEPKMGSLK